MKLKTDLFLHGLICGAAMAALYPVKFAFAMIMCLGILKEYGVLSFVYKWARQYEHVEHKDVDDIAADFVGCCIGYVIGWMIWS